MLQLSCEAEDLDWSQSRDSPTKLLLLSTGSEDAVPTRSLCTSVNPHAVDFLVFKSDPMMSDASSSLVSLAAVTQGGSLSDKNALLLQSSEPVSSSPVDSLTVEKCLRTTTPLTTDDLVNAPCFAMDGSSIEFSLLSQMSPFPAMSSSQVSSLLSSLEPNNSHQICVSPNQQRTTELPPPVPPLIHVHSSVLPPPSTPPQQQPETPSSSPTPPPSIPSARPSPSTSPASLQFTVDQSKSVKREVKIIEVRARELVWYRCAFCPYLGLTKDSVVSHFSHLHCHKVCARLKCVSCGSQFSRLHQLKQHYVLKHFVSLHELGDLVKLTVQVNAYWRKKNCENKKDEASSEDEVDEPQVDDCVQDERVNHGKNLDMRENHASTSNNYVKTTEENEKEAVDRPEAHSSKTVSVTKSSNSASIQASEGKQGQKIVLPNKEGLWKEAVRWKCSELGCHSKFVKEENLAYHKLCHEGNHFKCKECQLTFARWSDLTLHLWRLHSVDMELYSCPQCPFKTNSYSKLNNLHFRIHQNDRPFLCDVCGKGFKSPKQLGNHKSAVHRRRGAAASRTQATRTSNLVCTVCFRSFADPRLLRMHTDNVHKKVRPHVCNVCGYSASSSSSLKMHQRAQHTGEKPYTCPECDYSTSDHNSLRRHKMRHTGAKLYRCPHCSYGCIQSSTFKVHLKNKHPGRDDGLMFSCPVCPFRTVNREIFLTHSSSHSPASDFKMPATVSELPPALSPTHPTGELLLEPDRSGGHLETVVPVNSVFVLDDSIDEPKFLEIDQ